jgi:uncharacterized protein YbjQ (UPF0145 family)
VIIVTSEDIAHKRIVKTLGMVKGNTIRARHLGHDIAAVLKSMIGGEISDYTKMMAEAREQAIDRMIEEAKRIGANAIVQTRFSTSSMLQGASEFLVYGTAVIVENDD